jgi:hypothetical protein
MEEQKHEVEQAATDT